MLTKNNTSSDLTRKRQTRMQFANYIIQQQAVANGCLGRITIEGGSGGDKMASIFTDILDGQRFTTEAERDRILLSDRCPTTTSSSGGGSGPSPPDPPATGGEYEWGVSFYSSTTSTSAISTRASAVDSNGNIFVAGSYQNGKMTIQNYSSTSSAATKLITQTTFGLLPEVTTIPASFIVKYNSSGVAQWATNITMSAAGSSNGCYNIVTDSDGNVYSLHQITGTATVNSYTSRVDGGDITLTAYGTTASAGLTDTLIVKHDSDGQVLWVARVSSTGDDYIQFANSKNIGITSTNDICFCFVSSTSGANLLTLKSVDSGFTGGGGTITYTDFGTYSGRSRAIYVTKINSSGQFQWLSQVKPSTTSGFSQPEYSCAVDSDNNVFIGFSCYLTPGNVSFSLESYNGLSGSAIQVTTWGSTTNLGISDGYVAKVNSSGVFQACARMGTANRYVETPSIAVNANNNVIATFRYYDQVAYDANNKVNIYSSSGTDPAGGVMSFTAWASLPVVGVTRQSPTILSGADTSIIIFNSSLVAQSATYFTTADEVSPGRSCQIYSVDRDTGNNIFVNVRFTGPTITINSFSSLGTGGENNNINVSKYATVANSASGTFDCTIVKLNSSLVAQVATRVNDVTAASLVPNTISVDRSNGYLYSAGQFEAGTTGGVRFQDYGGVSAEAVTLSLAGQINSAATSGTARQGYMVKYTA